ncbi:hypothetical protein NADFUDRAFT_50809 [Nadsonia fulvescens var. elongata DSM 6958]|uniref:mRNA 3'-end-processing protein n=1 Tax=Nadsonia fulvescens var. elongata DSM 6958 TaxID=857566 RepID=A0A1E3PJ97_9ASCO|nr:hypothetical protein NADFUDRAFT_50809 [Nadsonia fulvescens var. elongata DSM 6958]
MSTILDRVTHTDRNQLEFAFEPFLKREFRFGLDPNRPICRFYVQGNCPRGNECPDKHILPTYSNKIVCKHWLRGLCKKGDACEFLHEYNLRKMPECLFFSKNGFCTQSPDCLYLHIDPMSKIPPCPNYEKGFCRQGAACPKRHVRKVLCPLFLTGFCPKGPTCENAHPKFVGIFDKLRIRPDPKNESYPSANSTTVVAEPTPTDAMPKTLIPETTSINAGLTKFEPDSSATTTTEATPVVEMDSTILANPDLDLDGSMAKKRKLA